ncbi:MAG: hypothetical protein IKA72_00285 [Clostridia bacterium]|nr:hypothetical protein [Clostridia bacterium]
MNEEIEYAEMLEIPVSTVNVIRKSKTRAQAQETALKEETISRVNERFSTPYATYASEFFENSQLDENQNEEGMYENNQNETRQKHQDFDKKHILGERILKAEFTLACALCLGIFLTNVWVQDSAINTFFRSITPQTQVADARNYTDFTLSSILGEGSDAEMTLSPTGILTFVDEGCVYPTADGTVSSVVKGEDGKYTVQIAHTESFSGVIVGLDYVYYEVGQTVKHNVPIGYSKGENEVQVTMYSDGNLLNCFAVTEDNALSWILDAE